MDNKQYYLQALVLFFKHQDSMDYQVIKEVLDIHDNNELSYKVRLEMIEGLLMQYGLYPTTRRYGYFNPNYIQQTCKEKIKTPFFLIRVVILETNAMEFPVFAN